MLKREVMQSSVEGVYAEEERRTLALSYLIRNLFEAKSLDECLDVAIKGLSMLDFFQSQISLLEDGCFVVKRNHMDKKYQFLLEQIWGRKFLGHKMESASSFASHLLNSKIVTTADFKDTVKVKFEDFFREYLSKEWGAGRRFDTVTRVLSIIPKRIDLLIFPLNYRGKVIGALGISATSLGRQDFFFLRNLCELFAQAFEKVQTKDDLRKSEEKYRQLVENLGEGIWVIDKDAYTTLVNPRMAEMLGYTVDEMQGKHLFSFMDERGVEICKRNLERRKEGIAEQHDFEFLRKDGTRVYTRLETSPITDDDGNYIGSLASVMDITKRKKAEEELVRLSSAVKTSIDGIVIGDINAKIIDVNDAILGMYGTENKGDLIGKDSFDLIAPEDREKAFAGMKETLEKGYTKGREYRIIIKNGRKILVEMNSAVMKNMDDKPIGFVSIVRDITERKKMEKALERQRDIAVTLSGAKDLDEALNRLFDNLLEIEEFDCAGFYLVDEDTAALDMTVHRGLPDGFVEKVGHLDADSPYAKVVMEGKPVYQKTGDFPQAIREDLQSDGILAVAAIPIHYKGEAIGDLNLASHTHDEISAFTRRVLESVGAQIGETIVRARMEEKLRESEEKLRQYSENLEDLVQKRTEELLESEKRYSVVVEEASDGVVILQDGKIVFTNRKAAEISGYSGDELIGFSLEKLVDERYRQLVKERYMQRMQGEKVSATYEVEVIAKTGERVPVEVSSSLMHYQGRAADLIIVRDIRLRKRMEEERLKLEKLATLGELAAMVGHDLRNPLQAITNAVYVLRDLYATVDSALERYNKVFNILPEPVVSQIRQGITKTFEKRNKMIHAIDESIRYANKIVSDLQDFARTTEPKLVEVDLESLIEGSLSDISIPENVKVSIKQDQAISNLYADLTQIRRVFINLTTNAIQAMPNGGELTISTSLENGFASIVFQDTGVGIPKENMEKLFTPLFTTKAKGIGLGLAICKNLVQIHGGSIEVESEVGKGSTFTVKLPIQLRQMEVKKLDEGQTQHPRS